MDIYCLLYVLGEASGLLFPFCAVVDIAELLASSVLTVASSLHCTVCPLVQPIAPPALILLI